MDDPQAVRGRRIPSAKRELARAFRRDMTPAERLLWGELRARRFQGAHFRRQHYLAGFIVDFYCHAAQLVIEVDGEVHLSQSAADAAREAAIRAFGVRVIRFSNADVLNDLPAVLVVIGHALSPQPSLPEGERE